MQRVPGLKRIALDPGALRRIANLRIVARLVVDGFLSGLHRSSAKGSNVEFAEHAPYMPGDEIRHIDWKLWAKTDRLHVKRFEEETSLRATVLVDVSDSMTYAGDRLSKLDYARFLAAALAYLMLRQQDAVGLALFAGDLTTYVPPRSGSKHLRTVLDHLEKLSTAAATDFDRSFRDLAARFRRRGLLAVVSDLYGDPAAVVRSLKLLKHLKHEVVVFHVLDPDERDFPFAGDTRFVDLETGDKLVVAPDAIRRHYLALMGEFLATYRNLFLEAGIDYVPLTTATPFDVALAEYAARRSGARA